MSRTAIWLANGVLVVLCCFLAARILTEVAAGVLVAEPAYAASPPPAAVARADWQDRQVILERNLFDSSTLAPAEEAPPEDEEEIYARTKLKVRLLATVAGSPSVSWAAVEDLTSRQTHVVRVSDKLQDSAEVIRIERRRIVLRNGGRLEELALDPEDPAAAAAKPRGQDRRTARRPPTPRANNRIQKLSENRFAVNRSEVQNLANNPAELFSQARILPKYEDGKMAGFQLNAIKPGSVFEQIGIKNGDIVREVNGITVDDQQGSVMAFKALTDGGNLDITVQHEDGSTSSLNYELRN